MFLKLVSDAGGPAARTILVGLAAAALLARGRWRSARLLVASVGGVGLFNTLIKEAISRKRPRPRLGIRQAGGYSFPSGHSSGSMALFATVTYLVWHITRRRATTAVAAVVGLASAGLVGYSRVALRHHHTGDVFAGYALAVGWLTLLLRSFRRTQERRPG